MYGCCGDIFIYTCAAEDTTQCPESKGHTTLEMKTYYSLKPTVDDSKQPSKETCEIVRILLWVYRYFVCSICSCNHVLYIAGRVHDHVMCVVYSSHKMCCCCCLSTSHPCRVTEAERPCTREIRTSTRLAGYRTIRPRTYL